MLLERIIRAETLKERGKNASPRATVRGVETEKVSEIRISVQSSQRETVKRERVKGVFQRVTIKKGRNISMEWYCTGCRSNGGKK